MSVGRVAAAGVTGVHRARRPRRASPHVLVAGRLPILLACLAVAAPLRAQELPSSLRSGERVRVTARGGESVSGIATSIVADGLQVSDSVGVVHAFNRNDIALVERSLGIVSTRGRNTRVGALTGFPVGGAVGLALASEFCSGSIDCSAKQYTAGALLVGLVGAGLGAVVGNASGGSREQWAEAPWGPTPSVDLTLHPAALPHRGLTIQLSLRL